MVWEGYLAALEEDPLGVAYVLGTTFKATPKRRAAIPDLQTELAWCIEIESGWRTDARNPISNASGLLQFMPSTAKAMGTTVEKLRAMSRVEQASYVQKFFDMNDWTMAAFGDVYVAVFFPAALGKPNEHVIAAKDGPNVKIWEQNPGLRESPDGPITVGRVRQLGTPPTEALPGPGAKLPPSKKKKGGKVSPPKPVPLPAQLGGVATWSVILGAWYLSRRRRRRQQKAR